MSKLMSEDRLFTHAIDLLQRCEHGYLTPIQSDISTSGTNPYLRWVFDCDESVGGQVEVVIRSDQAVEESRKVVLLRPDWVVARQMIETKDEKLRLSVERRVHNYVAKMITVESRPTISAIDTIINSCKMHIMANS